MSLLAIEEKVIGGRTFRIRALSYSEGKRALPLVQRYFHQIGDPALREIGLLMLASMQGALKEEDVDKLVAIFGPTTTVDFGDGTEPSLKDVQNQNRVFAGAYEDVYAWLDACIEVNFGGLIEKTNAAVQKLAEAAATKKAKA